MPKLNITAKDGKTLKINIPEGTDPGQYDSIVDDVMADYEGQSAPTVSPEIQKQQDLIDRLKRSGIDPTTIGPQETKLKFMKEGRELPLSLQADPFQTLGERATTALGEQGVNPYISAGVGTTIAMAPDIATSLPIKMGAVKALQPIGNKTASVASRIGRAFTGPTAEEAKLAAGELRRGFQKTAERAATETGEKLISEASQSLAQAKEKALEVAQSLKGQGRPATAKVIEGAKRELEPIRKVISDLRSKLRSLPEEAKRQLDELQVLDKDARKAINKAETLSGLEMKTIPEVPKDISGFANEMKQFAGRNPDDLLEAVPLERLQELKKIAQVTKRGNILPEEQAFINQGVEAIDQAISRGAPKVGEELGRFRQVQDAIKNLPAETARRKTQLMRALDKTRDEFKTASSEARERIRLAKETEGAELSRIASEKITEAKKKVQQAGQAFKKTQQKAKELLRQAKDADGAELRKIEDQARKLILEGLENSKTLRTIKFAAGAALGATGLTGLGSLLRR